MDDPQVRYGVVDLSLQNSNVAKFPLYPGYSSLINASFATTDSDIYTYDGSGGNAGQAVALKSALNNGHNMMIITSDMNWDRTISLVSKGNNLGMVFGVGTGMCEHYDCAFHSRFRQVEREHFRPMFA